jgi:hypothetical protein
MCPQNAILCKQVFIPQEQLLIDPASHVRQQVHPGFVFHPQLS